MTIEQAKNNLIGMSHSGSLGKVRNIEDLFERAANALLGKIDPIETIRLATLSQVIHDDLYNYPLPSDYKEIIDLSPQDNRNSMDVSSRVSAQRLDANKLIKNKQISIEGSEGSKFIRVNWKSNSASTFHSMDSLTANGTIAVVGTATGLKVNTLYYLSGSGSIEFDVVASGDGIQITGANALDMTNWDELSDVIFPVYIGDVTNLTSITAIFGNDLTANYWTATAQTTQADGTAFRNGWNWVKFAWSSATETGTVDPSSIDSFKITIQSTGAISNIRVDNIIFSLGRAFDIKYYSKYIFKNSSGTLLTKPTSDQDTIVLDNDSINIFLFESLKAIAQQIEGEDSVFDIQYANRELNGDPTAMDTKSRYGLYATYRMEHPSQSKKIVTSYSSGPRFRK